jgi:hypothetical protein
MNELGNPYNEFPNVLPSSLYWWLASASSAFLLTLKKDKMKNL